MLARTLDSVLSQSWTQIEHIIIDGASKDNTLAMAQAYSRKNQEEETEHEVVIVSEPDRGLYDAMNKGLARATGDYIVYLNAGDVFPSAHTLEQISIDVNNRSDGKLPAVLYGDTNIVDDEGRLLHPRRLAPPENLTWRSFRHGMLVCHQAFYARTDLAQAEPYDLRYRFSADVDWCIRIMKRAEREHLALLRLPQVVVNLAHRALQCDAPPLRTPPHHRHAPLVCSESRFQEMTIRCQEVIIRRNDTHGCRIFAFLRPLSAFIS